VTETLPRHWTAYGDVFPDSLYALRLRFRAWCIERALPEWISNRSGLAWLLLEAEIGFEASIQR
jgi:hypothetical protein